MKAVLQPDARAWVVMPVSAGWETLKFSLEPAKRSEENEVVVSVPASNSDATLVEVWVPTAFTQELKPPDRLGKNDPVMVATSGTRAFGRVLSAEPNANAKIRFRFAGTIEEKDIDPKELVRLDGTLRFGAPVGYGEEKEGDRGSTKIVWRPAQFVQSTGDKAWVVTSAGKPLRVPLTQVKPLMVNNTFRVGDKLFAARGDELLPGQLAEVLEDGLRYKIKLDVGDETTVGLEGVTVPIK